MNAKELKFPTTFRNIVAKYGIRNIGIAEALGVSSQYISKMINGKSLPSREQINAILQYLGNQNVPVNEQRTLISSFVEDKTGFFYEIADIEFTAKNPLEKKLINDFRMLDIEAQKEALAHINQLLIQSL